MTRRSDSKDRLRVWLKLLRTTHAIENALRENMRESYAITLPRFDVLAALARTEAGLTMTALSRRLLVSNGNVTGIIERLVADRLVTRTSALNDKRTIRVRLTPKGQEAFATIAAAHEQWVGNLLDPLDVGDVAALLSILSKLTTETERSLAPK